MDFVPVLRAIEAEIEKLQRIRSVVAGLPRPSRLLRRNLALVSQISASTPATPARPQRPERPEPKATVVPPRRKREYRARTRPNAKPQTALSSAPLNRPVFVPRSPAASAVAAPAPTPAALTPEQMEAAVRQNLLGGAA